MRRTLETKLAFTREDQVVPEEGSCDRAITHPPGTSFEQQYQYHNCTMTDWGASPEANVNLFDMGFDTIDISQNEKLQTFLSTTRENAHLGDEGGQVFRRLLGGSVFKLGNGRRIKILKIAGEGVFMREAGPNGMKIGPGPSVDEISGHEAAPHVHGDQDIYGTPLKQMMRGLAPRVFRHQSPEGQNTSSPFGLLNIWIPLQQTVRPLTLMDRRTLDKRKHQLRFALLTDGFLSREEDRTYNDIWTFLHSENQSWYVNPNMDQTTAYIFDTLGAPHGACILPGEDVVEYYFRELTRMQERLTGEALFKVSISGNDLPCPVLPENTPLKIKALVADMKSLHETKPTASDTDSEKQVWSEKTAAAINGAIRRSVELRALVMVLPKWWPGS